METNELLTAEMANVISMKKAITIETICLNVKNAAENGLRVARFFDVDFSNDVIKQVLNLGYEISKIKDANLVDVIKITW